MNEPSLTFIIDVDGTLCPIKAKEQLYDDLCPYMNVVEQIRLYKEQGARIVLFTSRNMLTYQGNIGLINKYTAPTMLAWLKKWDIPYDEIIFGKPWPGPLGYYVDDRAVRPSEFINHTPDELAEICKRDRIAASELISKKKENKT